MADTLGAGVGSVANHVGLLREWHGTRWVFPPCGRSSQAVLVMLGVCQGSVGAACQVRRWVTFELPGALERTPTCTERYCGSTIYVQGGNGVRWPGSIRHQSPCGWRRGGTFLAWEEGRRRRMLSLEGAWFFATGKLLTLSEQQFEDCDTVDSACTVGSWILGLRLPRRTPRFTADSACHGEQERPVHRRQLQFCWKKGTCSASTCVWARSRKWPLISRM